MFLFSGNDGAGQIKHFVKNDGFNTFRLPVGWQFLTNDVKSSVLNSINFAKYDALVQVISHTCSCKFVTLSALQTCLRTGSYCIIDIHNYARFNGLVNTIYHDSNWKSYATSLSVDHRSRGALRRDVCSIVVQYCISLQIAI